MQWDSIVVGQGIAGTVLTRTLQKRGKKVLVIDDHFKGSSSLVAAGLWNPIVFKKLNKTWQADTLLPIAQEFYQEFERDFKINCWHPREIVRVFASIEEQNNWMVRSGEQGFTQYLKDDDLELMNDQRIKAPHSYGQVMKSGNLDIPKFLNHFRDYLKNEQSILEEVFEDDLLKITESGVEYKGNAAKHIFFCQGQQGLQNKWFNYLPLHQTKGEVLTLRIKALNANRILNKGFFILPIGDDLYKVGATFNWKEKDCIPTEVGKSELLEKLHSLLDHPYEVVEHIAGLRPTVVDRRPIIGTHPEHPALVIYNGMGPKGVIYAPYTARNLLQHLYENGELDAEATIRRFDKKWEIGQ